MKIKKNDKADWQNDVKKGRRIRPALPFSIVFVAVIHLAMMPMVTAALNVVGQVQFQSASTPQETTDELANQAEKLKETITANATLDETARNDLLARIQAVESSLVQTKELEVRIAEFDIAAESAVTESGRLQKEIAEFSEGDLAEVDSDQPLEKVEEMVSARKQSVTELQARLQQNEQENTLRIARRQDLIVQLETISETIAETRSQIRTLPTGDTSLDASATRLELRTALKLAELTKAALLSEQKRNEAEDAQRILKLGNDLLALKLNREQSTLAGLEKIQVSKRQEQAKLSMAEAIEAQEKIEAENPLLAASYKKNTELAKRVQEIESETLDAKRVDENLQESVTDVQKRFRETRERVQAIGLTGAIGAMLRKQRSEMAVVGKLPMSLEEIGSKIEDIQYQLFDIDSLRLDLSPENIYDEIQAANGPQSEAALGALDKPIADLINTRKEKLDSVTDSLNRQYERLFEIQKNDRKLMKLVNQFREYIKERILWIRSNRVLFSQLTIDDPDRSVFRLASWQETGRNVWRSIIRWPLISCLAALLPLLLLIFKPRLRNEIDRLGEVAAHGSCDTVWPTTRTLVLTILVAITVPVIPLLFGLIIKYAGQSDSGALYNSLSSALIATGLFAMPFEVMRRMCRPQGLANLHFDWHDAAVATLKKNLDWVVVPGSVIVFLIYLIHNLDLIHQVDLIDRTLFVIGMFWVTWFLYQTFHPKFGIFADFLNSNERSWANQTSFIWFSGILLMPISFALLAFYGYYYTALNLAECAFATFVFAVAVELGRALMRRLILVRRRHVHIQASRRKRQAQIEAQREAEQEARQAARRQKGSTERDLATPVSSLVSAEVLAELQPEVDIDVNARQTYKLISLVMIVIWGIGLWMIWTDVLPALKALDNYVVWQGTQLENPLANAGESAATSAGSTASGGSPATVSTLSENSSMKSLGNKVSVGDLLLFIVISIVTWISARNLPSALEMLCLEDLPVDRSFRYAIKALTSYAIVMIGLVFAFRSLSIGWSSVQWLATALTFGLAFGLQEIFANFVAGIILMFERPIRIGDWITVDEFTGVVTKIRTRATTIVNWDRKEYVIPNKDFITGRLVNWTLSDAINRVEVNVGIAYGSDVSLAKKLLYEICDRHPNTVDDPAPQVLFNEFGGSSLNLRVRAFLGDIDSRARVTDDLHTQINNEFNDAGIEISFPQLDLHLRSVDGSAMDSVQSLRKE